MAAEIPWNLVALQVLTMISLTFDLWWWDSWKGSGKSRQLNHLSIEYRISEELLVVKDEIKLLSHFENVPWKALIDIFRNALNKFEVIYQWLCVPSGSI